MRSYLSKEQIEVFKKLYPTTSTTYLSKLFKLKIEYLMKKAHKLGIKKTKEYYIKRGKESNFAINNPILSHEVKQKAIKSKIEGYKSGRIKLSGIALKSSMGLTKKENHPNWLGGKSFEPYDSNFDKKFKTLIKIRDNESCVICGKDNALAVHHIDYNKLNTCKENCICLCNSCHAKTNFNRKYWKDFFQSMLKDRYNYFYNITKLEVKYESNKS